MSILSRLKNKLHDPAFNEVKENFVFFINSILMSQTKIREYDECMSLLKNENVELHKRIDQLEALVNKK